MATIVPIQNPNSLPDVSSDVLKITQKKETADTQSKYFYGPGGYLSGYVDIDKMESKKSDVKDESRYPDAYMKDFKNVSINRELTKPTTKLKHFLDQDSNNFRYGTDLSSSFYELEDPTFLAFDIFVDDSSSPLFNKQIEKFANILGRAVGVDDIKKRFLNADNSFGGLYSLFKNKFFDVFHRLSEASTSLIPTEKRHYYINKINELKHLHKPFIEYDKDKITITLTEDLKMRSQYLAELYNNLTYSYSKGKQMIPRNLLRFNMIIKVSDLRRFKTADEKWESSSIYYTLYDCHMNFMESKNMGEEITNGGFGQGANNTPASLDFNIYFKSVGITMLPPVYSEADDMTKISSMQNPIYGDKYFDTDKIQGLYDVAVSPANTIPEPEKASANLPKSSTDFNILAAKNKDINFGREVNNILNPINELGKKLGEIPKSLTRVVMSAVLNNVESKRKELLNILRGEITQFTDIKRKMRDSEIKTMGNVYSGDFRNECLKRIMEGKNISNLFSKQDLNCLKDDIVKDSLSGAASVINQSVESVFGTLDGISSVSNLTKIFGF